ncbi:MAG: hypothetical protein WBP13_02285 [Methylophilaceae bacterium]
MQKIIKFKYLLIILALFQVVGCNYPDSWGYSNSTQLSSKTLYVGFNGLGEYSKRQFYEDKKSLKNSWLKVALTPSQMTQLIDQVDFEKQFVLVYTLGKRANITGKITMASIRYTSDIQSKTSSVDTMTNIGIADYKDCNIRVDITSFPFTVELVERPKDRFKLMAASDAQYNFEDDCKKPVAGEATLDGTYLESKTLHIGFNGLSKHRDSEDFYEDKKSLENSWLKVALTPIEMTKLIAQVDFEKQFVLVYVVGERANITGKMSMDRIRYTSDIQSKTSTIEATTNIGYVIKDDCNISDDVRSFPFILQLVERPENGFKIVKPHYGQYDFRESCAIKTMSGQATQPPQF